jgi:uncharacterized membrane-anchored protein YhcB (DUF1043 family)
MLQTPMHGACPVTALLAAASGLVIGLFLGWLLTTTFVVAAISRAQERMQRKVRYWQAQTNYWQGQTADAYTRAERLADLLKAHGIQTELWEEQQ